MYQIFQSSLASHLSDGGSLGASKVHHEQHSRPHLLRHIHHPTTLLHRHLREGDVVCVCVHGVFSCYYQLKPGFLSVSCNCSVSGTPNATADDDLMELDPITLATHSSFSLVPRPCMFVTCSVKFTQNFVLQVTNVQGLGTRLLQSCFSRLW